MQNAIPQNLGNIRRKKVAIWAFGLGGAFLVAGLPLSPALISIATGLMLLGGLLNARFREVWGQNSLRWPILLLIGLGLLPVLGFLWGPNPQTWVADVKQKLPLLALPIAFWGFGHVPARMFRAWGWVFAVVVTLVAAHSLTHYFFHKAELDALVANGKEIPILKITANPFKPWLPTDIVPGQPEVPMPYFSHIYFGLFMAFASLWLGVQITGNAAASSIRLKMAFGAWAVLIAIALHIFTSRTGLLAFYLGCGAVLANWLLRTRKWMLGLVFLCGAICLPLGAYHASESFQSRAGITLQDMQNIRAGGDLTKWSLGRRYGAILASWHVFLRHPVVGVGPSNFRDSLIAQYANEPFNIQKHMQLSDPHNQYLEVLGGAGIIGFVFFIATFLSPLVYKKHRTKILLWILLLTFTLSLFFETMLERQAGLNFFLVFFLGLLLIDDQEIDKKSYEGNSRQD